MASDYAQVLEDVFRDRWSCRAFTPEEVPDGVIERLLAMAQHAPSWCNTQPWQVIITAGEGTERFRRELVEHITESGPYSRPDFSMPAKYTGVYRERRRESGLQLYQAVGVGRGDRVASARQAFKNYEFFGAPHVAILTVPAEQADYGAVDSGIYVSYFLLAAHSLGLGAISQAALAQVAPFIRTYFSVPETRRVLLGISFGYPDLDHPVNQFRTTRAGLSEVFIKVDK